MVISLCLGLGIRLAFEDSVVVSDSYMYGLSLQVLVLGFSLVNSVMVWDCQVLTTTLRRPLRNEQMQ